MARIKSGGGAAGRPAVRSRSNGPEQRFLNRELSWLDFNERVLQMAEDPQRSKK